MAGPTGMSRGELRMLRIAAKSAIATASWDLLREDGSTIGRWRQAYFMSQFGSEWRIYGSAFVSQ
jgi:hypothetical protein